MHRPVYFGDRHPFAFESHNPASMGKMLIPGDIIMYAFMAGDVHGCGMLVSGCWILDAGYSILDTGYWILVSGYLLLVTGFWSLVSGRGSRVAGLWNRDVRSSMLFSIFHNSAFRIPHSDFQCLRHLPSEIHSGLISPSYLLNF
jgi:hypothetical protein